MERTNDYYSDRLMRPVAAAEYLGLSVSTLAKLRLSGDGPQFLKLGQRLVAYRLVDLTEWATRDVRLSTSSQRSR